jgi:hypothetical protein
MLGPQAGQSIHPNKKGMKVPVSIHILFIATRKFQYISNLVLG